MKNDVMALRRQQEAFVTEARNLHDLAATENRDLSADEVTKFDELTAKADGIGAQIDREERLSSMITSKTAPAVNKTGFGDNEAKAVAHYVRTGDFGAIAEYRASNDTDMNTTTPADGGYAVPVGHYGNILAKRDTVMLADKLGVLRVPGTGLTTNVPTDNGTANVFVATNQASAFDRDAPVLGQAAMTLVYFSKKLQLSNQLINGEDSSLLAFLENYVGRAAALTHNSLLITEALAGGTSATLASVAAAAGDPQTVIYSQKGEYAEGSQWIMKRATDGAYRKLTGSQFQYAPTGGPVDTLWNYPVNWSDSVPAIGASNKSVIFGNFAFMGLYESPSITFLRDPYGAAGTGQVNLYYYFGAVYKTLVSEAICYGTHPSA